MNPRATIGRVHRELTMVISGLHSCSLRLVSRKCGEQSISYVLQLVFVTTGDPLILAGTRCLVPAYFLLQAPRCDLLMRFAGCVPRGDSTQHYNKPRP